MTVSDEFFRLGNPLVPGRARLQFKRPVPRQHLPIRRSSERKVLLGQPCDEPLDVVFSRPVTNERVIWGSWPGPFLVRDDVVAQLTDAGLSGWTSVKANEHGRDAPIEGFALLGITGRCDALEFQKTESGDYHVERVVAWDGTDFFLPKETRSFPLMTARAAAVLGDLLDVGLDAAVEPLPEIVYDDRVRNNSVALRWDRPNSFTAWEWLVAASPRFEAAFNAEFAGWDDGPPGAYNVFGYLLSSYLRELVGKPEASSEMHALHHAFRRVIAADDVHLLSILSDSEDLASNIAGLEPFLRGDNGSLEEELRASGDRIRDAGGPFVVLPSTPSRTIMPPSDDRPRYGRQVHRPLESMPPPTGTDNFRALLADEIFSWPRTSVVSLLQAGRLLWGIGEPPPGRIDVRLEPASRVGDLAWPYTGTQDLPPLLSAGLDRALRKAGLTGWTSPEIRLGVHDGTVVAGWVWLVPGIQGNSSSRAGDDNTPDLWWDRSFEVFVFVNEHFRATLTDLRVEPFEIGHMLADFLGPRGRVRN